MVKLARHLGRTEGLGRAGGGAGRRCVQDRGRRLGRAVLVGRIVGILHGLDFSGHGIGLCLHVGSRNTDKPPADARQSLAVNRDMAVFMAPQGAEKAVSGRFHRRTLGIALRPPGQGHGLADGHDRAGDRVARRAADADIEIYRPGLRAESIGNIGQRRAVNNVRLHGRRLNCRSPSAALPAPGQRDRPGIGRIDLTHRRIVVLALNCLAPRRRRQEPPTSSKNKAARWPAAA